MGAAAMTKHRDHAPWHSHKNLMSKLPIYFRHIKTGVIVEIDTEGVTTFHKLNHGHFRPFSEMHQLGLNDWGPKDEIEFYTKPGSQWRRIYAFQEGEGNA
jgi:hypothetical protein